MLSSNQPDPAFPPIPPLSAPIVNYVAPPAFGDLSGLPLEYQPITMQAKVHLQSVTAGFGGDPLTEDPLAPTSSMLDTTLTESPTGIQLS